MHLLELAWPAIQTGVTLRIAVIEVPGEELITLVNQEIVERQRKRMVNETCLSIPGYQGGLTRSIWVKVKTKDRYGKSYRIKREELLAQALEHEVDQLDGFCV